MNLTEPNAGSDLAAVRTAPSRRVMAPTRSSGRRSSSPTASTTTDNIIHLVLAACRTRPKGVKGISLFVVPKFMVNADGSRRAQRRIACRSSTSSASTQPHGVLAFGDNGRRDRYPGRRAQPRPRVHVHHDERSALRRSAWKACVCPSGLTSRRCSTPGSRPGHRRRRARRSEGQHHPSRRRASPAR